MVGICQKPDLRRVPSSGAHLADTGHSGLQRLEGEKEESEKRRVKLCPQ
jgi:hypothetical protein